jgi:signal transduction histidine kinase/DNA-binding response OmpR family regulator
MDNTEPLPAANVLVVDDNPENLKLLGGLLRERGYNVRLLPSGALTLRSVQANPPDAILLDIRLPDMDGFAICESLKADASTREIPVLFCSALDATFDKVRAFAAGGVDYITKPFDTEEVLARVATHVALRRTRRQLQQQNQRLQREMAERGRTELELQHANRELRRRIVGLSAINQIAGALTQWTDLRAAVEAVGATMARLFDHASLAVWLWDEPRSCLSQLAAVHRGRATVDGPTIALADDPVAARVLDGSLPKLLAPAEQLPLVARPPQLPSDERANAGMVLPLPARGALIGLLCIRSTPRERMYTSTDVALAQTIASNLASAIENARLFAAEQRLRRTAESLREVTAVLTSSLDFETVVRAIFEQLSRVVPYNGAAIFLVEGDSLVLSKGAGIGEPYVGHRISLRTADPAVDVFLRRRPRIIDDTSVCPDWIDWDTGDTLLSWMGAPLMIGPTTIGVLTTDHCARQLYGGDDLRALEAFAHQSAIAIENARLFARAQAAAAEEERRRLARELHDSVSQALFLANLNADVLPQLWEQNLAAGRRALADLQQCTRSALAEMRMLLIELRPSALVHTPLAELLQVLGAAVSAKHNLAIDAELDAVPALPPEAQIALYRIAQEAFNNIVKHAQATRVTFGLKFSWLAASELGEPPRTQIVMCIADDGHGFDHARLPSGGMGLSGMAERAGDIGASLRISSELGGGTRVEVTWSGDPAAARGPR